MTRTTFARALGLAALAAPLALAGRAAAQMGGSGYRYTTGKDLYTHICQGCHMPDGKGAQGAGAYPALAENPKLQAGLYPVLVILHGQKAMPSFSDLTDAQVTEVVNYIRTNLGNHYPDPVTVDQVKAIRSEAVAGNQLSPG